MAKEICISTTPHETRLAILEDDQLAEIYYERENEYTLAGSIYKGRVTRVLPGMQSAFVDVGLERDAFLYVTDFLEDQPDGEEYETTSAGNGRRPERTEKQTSSAVERPVAEKPQGEGRRESRRRDRGAAPPVVEPIDAEPELELLNPSGEDLEEKEEGSEHAPEGTRRWRGRRGRRRGGVRSGGLGNAPQAEGALPATAATPFALPEHGAPGGVVGTPTLSVEPMFQPEAFEPESVELHGVAEAETVQPRREREPRTRRSEAAPAGSSAPAVTLPGEALSKYGQAPAATEAAPAATLKPTGSAVPVNYVAPKPASLVESVTGWDGGSMLPGENLSRYRNAAPVSAARPSEDASASAEPTVAEPAHQETAEPAAEAHTEASQPAHAAAPVFADAALEPESAPAEPFAEQSAFHEPADASVAEHTATEVAPVEEHFEESFELLTEDSPEAAPEAALEEATDAEEHATPEYEPEEGASAARPTPPNTQELRLSQFFGFGDSNASEKKGAVDEPETQEAVESFSAHTEEPVARNARYEAAELEPFEQTAGPVAEEAVLEEPVNDNFTEMVDQLHGKGAVAGYLEEEIIDEEEYDFDPIHAHAEEHDLEELEEETLHGSEHEEEAELPVRLKFVAAREAAMTAPAEASFEAEEDEFDGDESAPFALEEVEDGDEGEGQPAADGEPARRERTGDDRARRGGRNGGRRGRQGGGGGGRRQSAQTQDLPIISDLLKQGQEILVQIAKEPIAKKGARITSHIALPGRFLVFMPTVNHVGVSRKIESDGERQRLKRILISEKGESSGGFIVRTAADGASEEELRADLRFLISLWTEIKSRADSAKAPALIYHDLNLVERILRDQVSSNFSTIWVDTEQEYERIVRFLSRFQPALVRRVKLYTKETPLFEHFGITEEISKALKSKVWLKSGGSIVINQTEALVAIDINTGKYVGKTARLEDTIVKTNLDAIPEIVRQIRLRDLGGIIVIDFIDMDERRNRNKVLQALEEAMKVDRAPSKVLQFNDFGLVAITRKRVKQSLERTLSVTCEVCSGTGMVKSPITVCNEIYIELRKMQKHLDGKDVMLRVHPEVVKQLKGGSARWINEYEEMLGKTIIIKSDPSLHPEQFDIH
jgi:ribonuclease E